MSLNRGFLVEKEFFEVLLSKSHDNIQRNLMPSTNEPKPADTARLSVCISRTLYRRFRLLALEQDTTLSALMTELIRKEVEQAKFC